MNAKDLLPDPPNNTESRFIQLMQRLWRIPAGEFQKGEIDLSMPQLRLIRFVSGHTGCHLQDIADGLSLSPPTVSVGIRKLEEGGWVERRQDPEDGRATCVYLTEQSELAIREALAHQKQIARLFFSGLSSLEQEQMLELLEKGITSMEDRSLR